MLALKMLFNTALADRNYPKSATVQNCFWVSEIATNYSPRFACGTVQSASKRSFIASKFAQRRTSNKRFKFVRFALWDCVPQPLNLVVRCSCRPSSKLVICVLKKPLQRNMHRRDACSQRKNTWAKKMTKE
jgi:hypothetical protein